MPTSRLHVLPCPADQAALETLLPALSSALDGTGPAVLPLPPDPAEAERVRAALRPEEPLERDDVAAVVATSGSTGQPKGALLTVAALRWSAQATLTRLGGPGRWLLALPAHHVAGLQVLLRSLVAGTLPAVLPPGPFSAQAFVAATSRLRGPGRRYASLVPTQLLRLLDAGEAGGAGGVGETLAALTSYDAVLLGGAATPPALLERARAAGVRVVTTYGMTETCGGCVYDGRPLDDVQVAVGDDGRIRLGGRVLFAGYRLRPDLTAEALVDGWHVTNDLGGLDVDGRLVVLGRADDVVVTGGENVALAQVEAALAAHPAVREAAAVAVADPEWGQRVVAVVAADERCLAPEELRAWVAARAGRAAAPRDVVVVPALPWLRSGKVDRVTVRTLAAQPATPLAPEIR